MPRSASAARKAPVAPAAPAAPAATVVTTPTARKTKAATPPAKPAVTPPAAPAPAPAPAAAKRKKPKLVRDGFTMPEADYALLGTLKKRALAAGREVKKSELLRAGLRALAALPDAPFLAAVEGVERIKPGRPSAG